MALTTQWCSATTTKFCLDLEQGTSCPGSYLMTYIDTEQEAWRKSLKQKSRKISVTSPHHRTLHTIAGVKKSCLSRATMVEVSTNIKSCSKKIGEETYHFAAAREQSPVNFSTLMLPIAQIQDSISLKVPWTSYKVKEPWPKSYCCCFANNNNYFLAWMQSYSSGFQIPQSGSC